MDPHEPQGGGRPPARGGTASLAPIVPELPKPGELICGKYRIESVIGTGGMGVVLGAVDQSLSRSVAIKFLAPQKAQRAGAVQRFLREARSAAALQSENVVRVYEVGTLPNLTPFIVMEHLRGVDLSQLLTQRGALGIDEACDLVLQTCEALGEAHGRGIVHRDLKPQNLFLIQRPDGSSCVKVLDFGISKVADEGGAPNLTATDTVMGTPLYMSPEQVRSLKNVDARADIWALGSILFELLTMSPIFQAPSASALCAMIAMDPPIPLRARRPQAPAELEGIILRCLHKDPAGRFQDVAALAEALAPFASERGRQSATRVSRVVGTTRASAPPNFTSTPPPGAYATTSATGTGPTMGDPRLSFVPSTSNFPRIGPSHPPPNPTTQSNWHQAGVAPAASRGSRVLVAVLGLITGLLLLGLGGGAYLYITRVPPNAIAGPLPTPSPADAGATATTATIDAGSPTPPASISAAPAPTSSGKPRKPVDPEAERNASLGKSAEQNCRFHTQQMTTFAQNDASRQQAAKQAKLFMCKGQSSSKCERQVCLNACMALGDQGCIRDITYVIEHGPAPKY